MQTITDQLVALAEGEFIKQPEVGDSTGQWSMFNDGGIECETGEMLYAFIRELKPANVLETGTHRGVGAAYMGSALKHNGFGNLETIEFLPEHYIYSRGLIEKLGLSRQVTCIEMDVADFIAGLAEQKQYDLVLLDTEPQTRFQELIDIYPHVEPGGYIFIHDLHRHMHQIPNEEHGFAWPYGELPKQIKQFVKQGKLRAFHFGTPRGLTMFYKPHSGDYKWS